MQGEMAHILLRIEVKQPIEVLKFAAVFTALARQYDKFVRGNRPDIGEDVKILVREIRAGSIEADLLPWTCAIISQLDKILIVEQFVSIYWERLSCYFRKNGRVDEATKSNLDDFMKAVVAIANDPNGRCSIQAIAFEKNERQFVAECHSTPIRREWRKNKLSTIA